MNVTSASFVSSFVSLADTQKHTLPAVVFVWRSNVWKSSLINMLVEKKGLAKTSSKPWKTQTINYFLINEERHLVDVPWYGYAKKSKEDRIERMNTLQDFLTWNTALRMTYVLIDWTIPLTKHDGVFLETLVENDINISIIITKTDKQKQSIISKHASYLKHFCAQLWKPSVSIFLASVSISLWKKQILTDIESVVNDESFFVQW